MNRIEKLGIPLTPDEKRLIGRAAKLCYLKSAPFIRRCALRKAKQLLKAERDEVLASNDGTRLSTAAFDDFITRVSSPAVPNEKLRKLLSTPSRRAETSQKK